jgi:hypothetical protein
MKHKILFIILILGLAATASAQGWRNNGWRPHIPAAETVTVSGDLTITHGMPAVKSGSVTYLIGGLTRLAGFIDGLKEGSRVTVQGAARQINQDAELKFLQPSKLTLNEKTYDLELPEMSFGPAPRTMPRVMPHAMPRGEGWGGRNLPRMQPRQPVPRAPRRQYRHFMNGLF